ncbi:tetratricopeptide repeat protein [Micromonospora sp. CPCC 205539]|uniref:tetratricopeptide repeat protein n=1 Tax=Micromonospora sp. CPCC 205539 TaxID=3122408 RepID=UPI002FEEA492
MGYSERARAAFRRGETATVAQMSRDEVAWARAAGDAPAEVEALYMLARLAVRADDLAEADRLAAEALAVAIRAGERHLEERPRHVLAAVARMTGDLARARDLYLDSIALNVALAQPKTVNSEYHNLGFTELRLGNVERAREIFAGVRDGVFAAGYDDFVPYALVASAVMAAVDGDWNRAARLLAVVDKAFGALGQVPDPDDAAELRWARDLTTRMIGETVFEEQYGRGGVLDPRAALATDARAAE